MRQQFHTRLGIGLIGLSAALAATVGWSARAQTPSPARPKASAAQDQPPAPAPYIVQEHIVNRVSEHVWEIPDRNRAGTPHIAIVVGSRATLVVDTGMGPKSGGVAAREAARLSGNTQFYLVTTDFKPEHITGAMAFPPNTVWVVPTAQKADILESTQTFIDNFTARSADLAAALKDVKLRDPDITFDRDATIDLGGGVLVHLYWFGPARTKGDVAIFVEPDRVLHGGNFLASKTYPGLGDNTPSVSNWLDSLDKLDALHPLIVIPNHGDDRDGSLISSQRTVLRDLQKRTRELKAQGATAESAGQSLTAEFDVKYPDWKGLGGIPAIVRRFYEDVQ